jgi:CRISPR-associated protein Cas2
VICYDIADPVRLRRVAKVLEAFGDRLQYSVFVCDLSRSEAIDLKEAVIAIMKSTADSVVLIDLGNLTDARFDVIGTPRRFPRAPGLVL